MNIYLLSQNTNNGWDTYDSCVVIARNEEEAKTVHPGRCSNMIVIDDEWFLIDSYGGKHRDCSDWAPPSKITCQLIGTANNEYDKPMVVCASFNAG